MRTTSSGLAIFAPIIYIDRRKAKSTTDYGKAASKRMTNFGNIADRIRIHDTNTANVLIDHWIMQTGHSIIT